MFTGQEHKEEPAEGSEREQAELGGQQSAVPEAEGKCLKEGRITCVKGGPEARQELMFRTLGISPQRVWLLAHSRRVVEKGCHHFK